MSLLRNYLLTSFRNLMRHGWSVSMSILGLAVAIGCSVVAWFNYELNSKFDKVHVNAANIYRVDFNHDADGKSFVYGMCPIPMGELLKENFSDIDKVIRYEPLQLDVKKSDELLSESFAFADPEFTDVFTLKTISGVKDVHARNVMIGSKLAARYFDGESAVGKNISVVINGNVEEFNVAGVFESFQFSNSFRFEVLSDIDNFFTSVDDKSITSDNWKRWNTTFVQINEASRIPAIEKSLQQFVGVQNEARPDLKAKSFFLEPFQGMANRSRTQKTRGHWFAGPLPPAAVIVMFVVSFILLGTACVNIINNTISMASTRLKEIGIRKTMGSRKADIRYQFFIESALICIVSVFFGLIIAEVLARAWDTIWNDIDFSLNYTNNPGFVGFITLVMAITIFLSGSYPAFFIARVQPNEVLKGKIRFGGPSVLSRTLLVIQLSISIMAVIFNVAFYRNSVYQENYDLGFSYHEVIQVPVSNESEFRLLRDKFESNVLVKSIGGSKNQIFTNSYKAEVTVSGSEREIELLDVGDNYFNTLGVDITSGRDFDPDSQIDAANSIIVNKEFVNAFNLGDKAVGTRILLRDTVALYIAGVTEEVYLSALFAPVQPIAFRYITPEQYQYISLRTDQQNILALNESAEKSWKELFPNKPYPGKVMDEKLEQTMIHFKNVSKLYAVLGGVTIILALTGLVTMISLHIRKKLKEIGLRKMLGGSAAHLSFISGKPFIVVVGISLLVGSIGGVFTANLFLDAVWAYYLKPEPVIILTAIALTILLAVLSVGLRIARATWVNPIEVIKEE